MERMRITTISEIDNQDLKLLESKNIFFGHQSVGNNILKGVKRIAQNQNIELNIEKLGEQADSSFCLTHAEIGQNGQPLSKIEDFSKKIQINLNERIDIAFFKFCYVDFNESTDINLVFESYVETIQKLKNEYPKIKFVHTTVPLRAIEKGPKAFLKKILKKSIGYENNIVRNKFNRLIIDKYKDVDPIFDIAKYESTFQNGERNFKLINGKPCYTLIHDYTNDGGHLNKIGEDFLGEQLLIFLAQL